jgi:hypothetical protein
MGTADQISLNGQVLDLARRTLARSNLTVIVREFIGDGLRPAEVTEINA